MSPLALQAFSAFVALYVLLRLKAWHRRKGLPFPPGPRGLPLVGNIRDIPSMPTWVTYRQWSDVYNSPIIRLEVLGVNLIILNSMEVITDLLDKRSAIYSDRPHMTMTNDLCGFAWAFSGARYDKEWRARRKAFHSQFHSQVAKRFRPIEEQAVHQFMRRLLESPEDFLHHVRHLAGNQIMQIAYGIKVEDHNDPFLKLAEEAMECGRIIASAGAYLVDLFPILRYVPDWFPGANFQRQAKSWRVPVMGMLNKPYAYYHKRVSRGVVPDCAATTLLESLYEEGENAAYKEEDIKAALATMYGAGSDTTVSAIQSFLLAMILYPEVQAKAQAELDRVCPARLPTFDDYDALPYVHSIVNEALRWNPVLCEAVPHSSTEDDFYSGYFIPKGSILIPNSWAILHDEKYYPDPLTFNPDRYIKDGELNPSVLDPGAAAFGYGRRVCPGRFMARDSIWITVACTLSAFNVQPVKGPDGKPCMPSGEYEQAFMCWPKPFKCELHPRSPEHEALVTATATA